LRFKIQLSMYGTIAERADVIIIADSQEEAEKIALERSENGEIKFSHNDKSMTGWQYQIEDCVKD